MKYHVHREHYGDRFYRKGDKREAEASDVAHLVRASILSPADDAQAKPGAKSKEKTAAKPDNKAAPVSDNKRDA